MTNSRIGIAAIAFALTGASAGAQQPQAAMVGAWSGSASITVDWTQQKALEVRVTLSADGSIAGTVGDATLVRARMRPNRTVLERAAHLGSDYIIEAGLDGPILRADGIQRASVRIPLDWNGSAFTGSVATNGTYDGGREAMKLMASNLVLRRASPILSSVK
jgi:hypothetical protein